eukprot:COSAG01_NODE_61216_length_290_cov_1.612565_1_plen_43_part_10
MMLLCDSRARLGAATPERRVCGVGRAGASTVGTTVPNQRPDRS